MKIIPAILCIILTLSNVLAFAGEVTVTRVVDGDTIKVWDGVGIRPGDSCMVMHQDEYGRTIPCPDQGHETVIRLIGIDTPEVRANDKARLDARKWGVPVDAILDSGRKARSFVAAIAPPGTSVTFVTDGVDVYGRTLAYVFLPDGRCLNRIIIHTGCGLAPERYRHGRRGEFAALEREARGKKRGFWKTIWKNL